MEPSLLEHELLRDAGLTIPDDSVVLLVRGLVVAFMPGMEMPLVLRLPVLDRWNHLEPA